MRKIQKTKEEFIVLRESVMSNQRLSLEHRLTVQRILDNAIKQCELALQKSLEPNTKEVCV